MIRVMIQSSPSVAGRWFVVVSEVVNGEIKETRGPGGPAGRPLTRRTLQTMSNHLAMYPNGGA